jgi:hypothetical protein
MLFFEKGGATGGGSLGQYRTPTAFFTRHSAGDVYDDSVASVVIGFILQVFLL